MKIILNLPPKTFLAFLTLIFLSTGFIVSDSCKMYYPMEKGQQFELTYFTDKGKPQGRTEYEIVDKNEAGGKMTSKVHMKNYDKKDNLAVEGDFEVTCENGVFEVDIRGVLGSAQMEQMSSMQGMDVSVSTINLELPSTMKVGDQLNDGQLEMKFNSSEGGMTLVSFNTYIKNRKIVASESVTTPAGTFDCLVISSEVESKAGFIKMNYQTKEWIAENIGVVRSETYRKDKLEGYTELTKFK